MWNVIAVTMMRSNYQTVPRILHHLLNVLPAKVGHSYVPDLAVQNALLKGLPHDHPCLRGPLGVRGYGGEEGRVRLVGLHRVKVLW